VVRQTPEAEQQMFLMQPGFRIDNVLADPVIQDPVGVTWDGNGRIYVREMRCYRQDADGENGPTASAAITKLTKARKTGDWSW
jgi:hypothetical protein